MATFTNEELYAPCFCGSGKKLKFCCKDKRSRAPTDAEIDKLEAALEAVDNGDVDVARPVLETLLASGLGIVEVRLGLVHVLVSENKIDEAIVACRAAWAVPGEGRDAAGSTLAQLLCLRGAVDEATVLVDDILTRATKTKSEPRDALALIGALNLLERDADIVAIVTPAVQADLPMAPYALAVAHLNLGDRDRALPLLRAAREAEADSEGLLELVEASSPWPWTRFEALPLDLFLPSGGGSPFAEHAGLGAFVDDEAASHVIVRALRSGLLVRDQPRYVDGVLGFIAELHPAVALPTLRDVWESQWSTPSVRARAASKAVAAGLIAEGSPTVDGVAKRFIDRGHEALHALFALSPAAEKRLAHARLLMRAGRSKRALDAFEALLTEHPDSPVLQHLVLAQKLMMRLIDDDTFIAQSRALIERAPRLLEGRQALARLLAAIDRTDEATAVLNDGHLVDAPDEEVACFAHLVLANLAIARGEQATIERHAKAAETWLGHDLLRALDPQLFAAVYDEE